MKTVLIVDDEEKIRKLVEVTLSVGKYNILHAASGKEAIQIVRESSPDLCLLDIIMAGELDGLEVCRTIKRNPQLKHTYVILLTARNQQGDKEAGMAAGADDYFVKPFSPMALLKKIETVLA